MHVGGGKFRTITREELDAHRIGTKALLADGHDVAILLEHPDISSDEGIPMPLSKRQAKAELMRNTVGRLIDVEQDADGALVHVSEITDPKAAEALKSGAIRYVSPEFRSEWVDGTNKVWRNVISHLALTHRPRATDQGTFEIIPSPEAAAVLQCSLADLVEPVTMPTKKSKAAKATQFATDDDEAGEGPANQPSADAGEGQETGAPPPAEETNPDMPDAGNPQLEALIAHLKAINLVLPADTTEQNLVERLLVAVATYSATTAAAELKSSSENDEGPDMTRATEDEPVPMQYSVGDEKAPAILKTHIKNSVDGLNLRLHTLINEGRATPALAKMLKRRSSTMQFSAEGGQLPLFTVDEVVSMLEEATVPGAAFLQQQFSTGEDEAGDDAFLQDSTDPRAKDTLPTGDKAKEIVARQLAASGVKRKAAAGAR